ncbi:MAG TPA: cob(I)yrinic acid a,c-diamide adenosyltransferase [Actinomycetota bacterium]|nr:cob(I)yrinic acid a,c-diamide adenosyltransferase [Actinomycetota bacterium]
MRIYTRTGDDGTTGLLYGGRIGKDDLRVEAYGTSDEAVAALGVARAVTSDEDLRRTVLRLQRELFALGAQIATSPENAHKLSPDKGTKVTGAMVEALERLIDDYESRTDMPREFVIPGETAASAALDLARAIVRRCERRCVELARTEGLDDDVLRYLNRLADLVFVLARYEERGFTPLHER